ncbi:MAG: hypothetical protein R6X08_01725 [Desulfosalsimonadaceae bacterium]
MGGKREKAKKPDKSYDVVVAGSGSGMAIVENAINEGGPPGSPHRGGRPGALFSGQHIHPALSEIIPKAFSNLSNPE